MDTVSGQPHRESPQTQTGMMVSNLTEYFYISCTDLADFSQESPQNAILYQHHLKFSLPGVVDLKPGTRSLWSTILTV